MARTPTGLSPDGVGEEAAFVSVLNVAGITNNPQLVCKAGQSPPDRQSKTPRMREALCASNKMPARPWVRSARLETSLAHHLAPFVGFGCDELAEVGRRARGRLTAKLDEPPALCAGRPHPLSRPRLPAGRSAAPRAALSGRDQPCDRRNRASPSESGAPPRFVFAGHRPQGTFGLMDVCKFGAVDRKRAKHQTQQDC
jgi:hypothetical protein